MIDYDISYDDAIDLLRRSHELETKLEMVKNALEANVPHRYILMMLDGPDNSESFFCGPFFGGMEEEEDEDDT